jgi:hypothetical protein
MVELCFDEKLCIGDKVNHVDRFSSSLVSRISCISLDLQFGRT